MRPSSRCRVPAGYLFRVGESSAAAGRDVGLRRQPTAVVPQGNHWFLAGRCVTRKERQWSRQRVIASLPIGRGMRLPTLPAGRRRRCQVGSPYGMSRVPAADRHVDSAPRRRLPAPWSARLACATRGRRTTEIPYVADARSFRAVRRVNPEWYAAQVRKVTRSRSQLANHCSSTSRAATASMASTASSVTGCSSFHDPLFRSMNNNRHAQAARLLPSGNG